ncbi:hypothetical protein AYX15_00001 [Cryptococcus neoformans]|nr:hypothetical protein AYX15_00001 [Cryptococcus neoformans var. grubii]
MLSREPWTLSKRARSHAPVSWSTGSSPRWTGESPCSSRRLKSSPRTRCKIWKREYIRLSMRLSLTAHDSLLKSSTNRADHDIDHDA